MAARRMRDRELERDIRDALQRLYGEPGDRRDCRLDPHRSASLARSLSAVPAGRGPRLSGTGAGRRKLDDSSNCRYSCLRTQAYRFGGTMSTTTQTTVQALPAGTWTSDPVHSEVAFSVDYMAGTFHGTFSKFDVRVTDGRVEGTVDVSSIQVRTRTSRRTCRRPTSSTQSGTRSCDSSPRTPSATGTRSSRRARSRSRARRRRSSSRGRSATPRPTRSATSASASSCRADRPDELRRQLEQPAAERRAGAGNDVTLIADLQLVKAG